MPGKQNRTPHIVKFPGPRPVDSDASWWQIARARLGLLLGRLFHRLGLPGAIRSSEIVDESAGLRISISVGPVFTRVSVNGRDYYFGRWSGTFEGTGSGQC